MESAPMKEVSSDRNAETTTEGSRTEPATPNPETETARESTPTVREIFSLPKDGALEHSPEQWKAFREKISEEVKGIKWTVAMSDLAPKICELLDIKIPNILVGAWKKAGELKTVLEKSRKAPDEVSYLQLADHTINSEHKPSIDMKIRNATVKKIELAVQLGFNLKGFVLRIQNGAIREVQTGQCEARGTIKYGNLTIAEKKLQPINLPLSIAISASDIGAADAERVGVPIGAENEGERADSDPIERIEL